MTLCTSRNKGQKFERFLLLINRIWIKKRILYIMAIYSKDTNPWAMMGELKICPVQMFDLQNM